MMTRKSRKVVEEIPIDPYDVQLRQNVVIRDIILAIRKLPYFNLIKFDFMVDDVLVSRVVDSFSCNNSVKANQKSSNGVMFPVLRKYSDGTSEVCIREVSSDMIRMKPVLESVFIKDGVLNPHAGKWMLPNSLYGSSYPTSETMRYLHMYNGDDEECIDERSQNWLKIYQENNDDFTRTVREKGEVGVELSKRLRFQRRVVERNVFQNPPKDHDKCLDCPRKFITFERWSYLKSVYRNVTKRREVSRTFKLSDLIAVSAVYGLPSEIDRTELIWDSMDSTLHGKILR